MGDGGTPASPELFGLERPDEAVASSQPPDSDPREATDLDSPVGRRPEPPQDPGRSPNTTWPAWSGPLALLAGLVLTTVLSLLIDAPAAALGAKVTGSHTPPGLTIADTLRAGRVLRGGLALVRPARQPKGRLLAVRAAAPAGGLGAGGAADRGCC